MTTYASDKFSLKTTQGDDWEFPVVFSTRLNGVKTPINLTGATFSAVVRPTYTTGTLTTMAVVVTNAAAGAATFSLTDTQTAALPAGSLVYQIAITQGGVTTTYLSGNFIVKPKVSTV